MTDDSVAVPSGRDVNTEIRVPLLNASASGDLDFGSGFTIRTATESEKQRWNTDPHVRDVVPHRVMPEVHEVLVVRPDSAWSEHPLDVVLMVWFGAASLCSGRAVEAAFCEEWHRTVGDAPDSGHMLHGSIAHFSLSLPVSGAPPWQGQVLLHPRREPIAKTILAFFGDHHLAPVFRFALSRWLQSLNRGRRSKEDAVLDLSIALESIFIGRQESRDGIAKALRQRISAFWCDAKRPKDIRTMRRHVNDAYAVRSKIAHGDVVSIERLDEARKTFDAIIREVLLDFAEGNLEDFDPVRLWDPAALPRAEPQ